MDTEGGILSGGSEVMTLQNNTSTLLTFFTVTLELILDGTKVKEGKIAGALALVETGAPTVLTVIGFFIVGMH